MSSGMCDVAIKSLKEIKKELVKVAELTVKSNSDVLIDMNTENLMRGLDSDNDKLTPEYSSDEYAAEKNRMNSKPGEGTPDLFLEGDFHGGFFVKRAKMGWEIDSKDSKRNKLANKYGEGLFGNNPEDEKEFNQDYIIPEMVEYSLDNLDL